MSKTDIKFRIEDNLPKNVIVIEDFGEARGHEMKCIHNILLAIAKEKCINLSDFMIIYRNRAGRYDGYDFGVRGFVSLGCLSWKPAVTVFTSVKMMVDADEDYPNGSTLP